MIRYPLPFNGRRLRRGLLTRGFSPAAHERTSTNHTLEAFTVYDASSLKSSISFTFPNHCFYNIELKLFYHQLYYWSRKNMPGYLIFF